MNSNIIETLPTQRSLLPQRTLIARQLQTKQNNMPLDSTERRQYRENEYSYAPAPAPIPQYQQPVPPGTVVPMELAPQPHVNDNVDMQKVCCYSWIFAIVFIIITLVVVIPVTLSFGYVNYDQIAFVQDNYGSVDTSSVKTNGRYLIGPTYKMVLFPATYQHISYITQVFTNDGYQIDIETSFFYRLNPNTLSSTYNIFSNNYESRIISNSKSIIKNAVTQYGIDDYIQRRQDLEYILGSLLQQSLYRDIYVDVPQKYFRILSIRADALIATSLISAIQKQNNIIQQNQQAVNIIDADTRQLVAEIIAQADLILAYAQTQANQIIKISENTLINQINAARSAGFEIIFSALNITDSNIKDEFVKVLAYIDANNSKIVPIGNNIILNV